MGAYSIEGARAGKSYAIKNKDNKEALSLINDFEWLQENLPFDTLQFLDRIERLYPEQEYNLTFPRAVLSKDIKHLNITALGRIDTQLIVLRL